MKSVTLKYSCKSMVSAADCKPLYKNLFFFITSLDCELIYYLNMLKNVSLWDWHLQRYKLIFVPLVLFVKIYMKLCVL